MATAHGPRDPGPRDPGPRDPDPDPRDPGASGTNAPPPRQRATHEVLAGRRRAAYVAARLGVGLRDARVRAGRTQQECAATARLSQAHWSNLERGLGASAPLVT